MDQSWSYEEDPEMLRLALEMIDTWQEMAPSGTIDLGDADSDEAHAIATLEEREVAPRSRPKQVNDSRARRRREIAYLRDKVAELATELKDLQTRRDTLQTNVVSGDEVTNVAVVWEGVATRQSTLRQKAELLNRKLRAKLATQLRVAQEMIKALQKIRSREEVEDDWCDLPTAKRLKLPIDASQAVSDEMLLQRVAHLRAQSSTAFDTYAKFRNGAAQFLDIAIVREDDNTTVFEVNANWLWPFPVEQVEEVTWKLYLEESVEDAGFSFRQNCQATETSVVGAFKAHTKMSDMETDYTGKVAAERFRDNDDRMHVAFYMYTEMDGFSPDVKDVVLHEDGCLRIQREAHCGGIESMRLTQVQMTHRLELNFEEINPGERKVGALTEFLMRQVEGEMRWGQQITENLLLQMNR